MKSYSAAPIRCQTVSQVLAFQIAERVSTNQKKKFCSSTYIFLCNYANFYLLFVVFFIDFQIERAEPEFVKLEKKANGK